MAAEAGEADITAATVVTGTVVITGTAVIAAITATAIAATMGTDVITADGIRRFILESGSVIRPMDIMAIQVMVMLTPLPHIPRTLTLPRNSMRRHQPVLAQAPRRL
jgi:hypothetical protein